MMLHDIPIVTTELTLLSSSCIYLSHSCKVGTNSGMEHDWTTGLSYFPFLDKFLNSFWKPATVFMI